MKLIKYFHLFHTQRVSYHAHNSNCNGAKLAGLANIADVALLGRPRKAKNWLRIFNNDRMLTSALLDRLLHHTKAVVIEGKSYRIKEVKKG